MDGQAQRLGGDLLGHAGQLENTARLREVRKDIARIYTVLQERNLGIVDDPDREGEVEA